jgi:hypothetical protein
LRNGQRFKGFGRGLEFVLVSGRRDALLGLRHADVAPLKRRTISGRPAA